MVTRYIPIELEPKVPCTGMELYDLQHTYLGDDGNPLTAYFSLPVDKDELLKIFFRHADIVRVLDEVYLSTEEHGVESSGLVPYHFAYRVENSRFWLSQSEFYRELKRDAAHYRFITGGACLDILATVEPRFSLVRQFNRKADPDEGSALEGEALSPR
ncbi:hypothetical protein [Ensifer sp. B1-9]|uniref:hypothetical protein n=1 Tax=Ensifer sp. B1-9 TaxID=3141455 RepID=UPI003D1DA865